MERGRGQVSMEFLLISGFAVMIIIPTLYIFSINLKNLQEEKEIMKFNKLVNELDASLRELCYMGNGAKKTLRLDIPYGFQGIDLDNTNTVIYNYSNPPKDITISKKIPCNATIRIPKTTGFIRIYITNQGGILNVTN